MRGKVALGLAAWGLAACTQGETYPLSVSEVQSRLRGLDLPAELGFGAASDSDAEVEQVTADAVTWRLRDHGEVVGWAEAKLDPVDLDHTRVSVDFRMADTTGERIEHRRKFMNAVGGIVLTEAVDAELENRHYNKGMVQTRVIAYAITHREEVEDFKSDLPEMRSEMANGPATEPSDARQPEMAVERREIQTERSMAAASAPSLNLGSDQDRPGY